ncbi:MAG: zinc ribbon domain-containing protein [Candidatus Thorarchaeota archaeon]|jgi:transposase
MGRSKGTIVSVKVPINWGLMTVRKQKRLSRITSRDTSVIRAYIGIIAYHEKSLLVGKKRKRIDAGRLDKLTLTAERFRDPKKNRTSVPHDFKRRFPNISQNELQECRDLAIAMWDSYLERGGSPPLRTERRGQRKISRNIFTLRFKLVHRPNLTIKHWLEIRDSLDSVRLGRTTHDKLTVPLKISPFHLSQIGRGEVKSCRINKDKQRKWWVIFAVKVQTEESESSLSQDKPLAVMGIDLGIDKAACAVVLTHDSIPHTEYFYQPEKESHLVRYESRIASLQKEMDLRKSEGLPHDKVMKKLRQASRKRAIVSEEWNRVLVREIVGFASELTKQYDLYVAVGNPKGIRGIAQRGYSSGRKYRRMIHRWPFARIILGLEHRFAQLGWTTGKLGGRFLGVYEGRTSIYCHKCGQKGVRPRQSLFVCHTCGFRTNADMNGAVNIARRMIRLTPALRDEHKGLGGWLLPWEKSPPKAARRARSSKRKSSLPQRSSASQEGESAVVRFVQMDLSDFGDETRLSDEDPAVGKAAETLSPSECLVTPRSDAFRAIEERKEVTFRERNRVPMTSDNAHVTSQCENTKKASDDRHELDGTQKLQIECEFRSPTQEERLPP